MDVIEYSLGSQKKAEVYVNRLLAYFLDPEEPHGMGSDFLRAVLDGLPTKCGFQEDVHDLSDVAVDDQVRVNKVKDGTTKSSGIVDLFIAVPNEWFLMIELKFSAEDTQTEFYYREATHVGGQPKAAYESRTYYLYLHQHDQPPANEPDFSNWTWKAFSADVLEPFLFENAARYPQRTVAQLREFNDDIRSIAGMTDQQENAREKIALYLEHYDAIRDVSDTFDSRWDDFTDEWGTQLGEAIERDGIGSYSAFDEDLTAIELEGTTDGHRDWKFRTSSSDWGMIFKDGWWRHTDDLDRTIYARPDNRNDVRIGFHHRLERNRDLAVGERTLKIYFRNMGANDQEFIDAFADRFSERQSEIANLLPRTAEVTGNKRNMIAAPYDIDADSPEEFFDAYVGALKAAFVDLVVDNEKLVALIDEIYAESIHDVYGVSIRSL
ncbi:PD-(D/E)XK nuclease family protein [Natronorubrum sp. FCH18a]|uniref:PD-(D/E)XK nuclease family protein n=1 Tax=Natronorubrum sp. FCH18a TaxID=3447018 RepID=UPI003F516589